MCGIGALKDAARQTSRGRPKGLAAGIGAGRIDCQARGCTGGCVLGSEFYRGLPGIVLPAQTFPCQFICLFPSPTV